MDPSLSHILRREPPENLELPAPTLLDQWAEKTPTKEALVYLDDKGRHALTFQQLAVRTHHIAAWFHSFGLNKGDRVAIFSKNCIQYALCDLALMRIGVCLTRLYTNFSAQQDLPDMIRRTDSRLLLIQESSMDNVLEFIPELLFRMNGKRLECDNLPVLEQVIAFSKARDGFLSFEENYEARKEDLDKVLEIQKTIKMEDDCTIHPTSGSTGKSKLAVISFYGYTNLLHQTLQASKLDENDRLFTDRPMAHPLGSIMPLLQCGCTMVVGDSVATIKNSDYSFLRSLVRDERITAAIFLPYMMYDIVKMGNTTELFSNLKFAICSGQTAPPDVMAKILDVIKVVVICYGCSEAGEISCTVPEDDLETISHTVGRPVPHLEIRVVNEQGQVVPRNTTGLMEVNGFSFKRYHGDEVRTKEALPLGWFRPGDMAKIDEKGRLLLLGRETEVISMATRKVFPAEIENVLAQHSKVDKAVAFGIPDKRLYECIGVCVKPKLGCQLSEQEVKDYFETLVKPEDILTGIAFSPSHVIIKDQFPMTSSGKIDRKTIKVQCLKDLGH